MDNVADGSQADLNPEAITDDEAPASDDADGEAAAGDTSAAGAEPVVGN